MLNYDHREIEYSMQRAAPLPPGVRHRQEKGTGEFRFGSGSVPSVVLLGNHTALLR